MPTASRAPLLPLAHPLLSQDFKSPLQSHAYSVAVATYQMGCMINALARRWTRGCKSSLEIGACFVFMALKLPFRALHMLSQCPAIYRHPQPFLRNCIFRLRTKK